MENLFPFQDEGARWLSRRRFALLADEMGLGKTAQVVNAIDRIGAKSVLVVCPSIARENWKRELSEWSLFDRSFRVLTHFNDKPAGFLFLICSFEYASTFSERFTHIKWDLIVIDESHFLKSLDAKRAKAVMGAHGLAHHCERMWHLSGTPAPNHVGELWIPLYAFGVTALKYEAFIREYCEVEMTNRGLKVLGTKMAKVPELKALLSKIMLRRRKDEVMKELPDMTYEEVVVEPGEVYLDEEQSFIHYVFPIDKTAQLKSELEAEQKAIEFVFSKEMTTSARMRALEGLANSVSTLRRYNGLQKVEAVGDLIASELKRGEYAKIVLFCLHRDVIERLRVRLNDFNPVTLYGGTPPEKRERHIRNFQEMPNYRVFIGNILASGTNITLTSAHHVGFVEQDWVPANNAQAAMRCHRIGQRYPVSVRFFSLANSIDQRVSAILKRKTKELTAIFGN